MICKMFPLETWLVTMRAIGFCHQYFMVLVCFLKGVFERHKQDHIANILQQQQKYLFMTGIYIIPTKEVCIGKSLLVEIKACWWKCSGTARWGVAERRNSYRKLLNCKKLPLHSHHRKHLRLPKEKSNSVLGWPQASLNDKLSATRYYKGEQTF